MPSATGAYGQLAKVFLDFRWLLRWPEVLPSVYESISR